MLEPQTAFGCLGKISKVWHFLKADFGVEISFPPPQNPRSRDTAQRHPAPAAKAASPRWGGLQGWETNPSTAVPWGCSSKTPSLCTAQPWRSVGPHRALLPAPSRARKPPSSSRLRCSQWDPRLGPTRRPSPRGSALLRVHSTFLGHNLYPIASLLLTPLALYSRVCCYFLTLVLFFFPPFFLIF